MSTPLPPTPAPPRAIDAKDNNALIIEGLAYGAGDNLLLFGLRGPVVNDRAVALSLDVAAAFSNDPAPFVGAPAHLDLDGGGIRSMAFSPIPNGYLIISRKEKRSEEFKLWLWRPADREQLKRIRLPEKLGLAKAEGIAPMLFNGVELIMVTFDSGKRYGNRSAEYLLLSYDQLEIKGEQRASAALSPIAQ